MVKLVWLKDWQAYAVRYKGKLIGLVRCKLPFPFRLAVEFI